ncbi:glutathione S-transferase [Paracoccus sp. (in: a-proteobacteria)]|uniref:glutathione S-transferase n=1 Tax=Paracoccus sp. TaxID=267 RepID=UPI0035AFB025
MTLALFYSPTSPYVRKVRIIAAETGTTLTLIPAAANPVDRSPELVAVNPLGKVPCLRLESGELIYDSRVICRYLGMGHALYPTGAAEWRALRREALADGLLDAALLARYETFLRPENLRWQGWIDGQLAKIGSALAVMAADAPNAENPDIGDFATACALFYLDFRYPQIDWRGRHPQLADFAAAMAARPAFRDTQP